MKSTALLFLLTSLVAWSCAADQNSSQDTQVAMEVIASGPPPVGEDGRVQLSETEWRLRLTPEQFKVTRQAGTEPAFTGTYWDEHAEGTYQCVGCALPLFDAETKYESGTGWPSFWQPVASNAVKEVDDSSFFTTRTEILCSRCDAHLGHVFRDGPRLTGLRYCINSAALNLIEK